MVLQEEIENIFLFNKYLDNVIINLINDVKGVNNLMRVYHDLNEEYSRLGLRTFKNTDIPKREVVYLTIFKLDKDKRYIKFKLSDTGEIREVILLKGIEGYKITIGEESNLILDEYDKGLSIEIRDYNYIKFKLKDLYKVINKEGYLNLGDSEYILNKVEGTTKIDETKAIKSEYLTKYYDEYKALYKEIFGKEVELGVYNIKGLKYISKGLCIGDKVILKDSGVYVIKTKDRGVL